MNNVGISIVRRLLSVRSAPPAVVFGFRIVLAIVLYGALLRIADLSTMVRQLAGLDWAWLMVAVALQVLGIAMSALRWQLLLAKLQVRLPYRELLLRYWSGTFYSMVLPGSVGGDVVRVGGLVRQGVPLASSALSVLADRLVGLWALILIGLLSALWPSDLPYRRLLCLLFGGIVLAGPVMILLLQMGRERIPASFERYVACINLLRSGNQHGFAILVLGFQLLVVFHLYTIAQAVQAPVSPIAAGLYIPAVVLATMLPISLNGIGIREVSLIMLLAGLGVPHETAVLTGTLILTTSIISALPGGLAILALPREYHPRASSSR